MRIIIAPAKKMNADTDSLECRGLPQFLPKTQRLLQRMREMDPQQLQKLWKCNDSIAELNIQRLKDMDAIWEGSRIVIAERSVNVDSIQKLVSIGSDRTVLVVCHGGVCRLFRAYFENMTNDEYYHYSEPNGAVREYEL